jgi:hypothetical protein
VKSRNVPVDDRFGGEAFGPGTLRFHLLDRADKPGPIARRIRHAAVEPEFARTRTSGVFRLRDKAAPFLKRAGGFWSRAKKQRVKV